MDLIQQVHGRRFLRILMKTQQRRYFTRLLRCVCTFNVDRGTKVEHGESANSSMAWGCGIPTEVKVGDSRSPRGTYLVHVEKVIAVGCAGRQVLITLGISSGSAGVKCCYPPPPGHISDGQRNQADA